MITLSPWVMRPRPITSWIARSLLIVVTLLVVCWRWELVGGILLIIAAVAMTFFFGHLYKFQSVLLMLEGPIALMGVLLIFSFFRSPVNDS